MMAQFSQPPKPQSSNPELEAWREYAARVSQAIRDRREDAYRDSGRNDAGGTKTNPASRPANPQP